MTTMRLFTPITDYPSNFLHAFQETSLFQLVEYKHASKLLIDFTTCLKLFTYVSLLSLLIKDKKKCQAVYSFFMHALNLTRLRVC